MGKLFFATVLIITIGTVSTYSMKKHDPSVFPVKTSVSENVSTQKLFGVNISVAEFGEKSLPGVLETNYLYPSSKNAYKGNSYFAEKKLSLIRIPFSWERIQHDAFGPLFQPDIDGLHNMIADATINKQKVILDLHNFGEYYQQPLTTQDADKFADVWNKLSNIFSNNPTIYGYELMNEPHDIQGGCETWKTLSQSAITAIRKNDMHHIIFVPGYSWQSAKDWPKQSDCLKELQDPANKLVFSAHQYFDSNFSGQTYDSSVCNDDKYGPTIIQPFLTWLQRNNAKGIFTEYGVNSNSCWTKNLDNFLTVLNTNTNIIGGTYWSAGPWWGNYALSVEPNQQIDAPQMNILEKYPTHNY